MGTDVEMGGVHTHEMLESPLQPYSVSSKATSKATSKDNSRPGTAGTSFDISRPGTQSGTRAVDFGW